MFKTAIFKLPTKRTFHTSAVVWEEWTKASLRRMKKPELTRLAKENNLKTSGTKNDIIIQLLTHQTAKIVGTNTPSVHTIQKVIQEEEEGDTNNEDLEADNGWMNAFEMKVAQRGSRKPMDINRDHFTSKTVSKPHPFNDQIKASTLFQPTEDKPKPTSSASPVPSLSIKTSTAKFEPTSITTAEEIEGMDPQWVEAFDLKVGSRGARHQLADTLSPTTPPSAALDEIEFIKIDTKKVVEDKVKAVEDKVKEVGKKFDHVKKHIEKHGSKHYHNVSEKKHAEAEEMKDNASSDKQSTGSSDDSDTNSNSSRETWINTAVGSSMFVWYYSEGLSKIWHFLTSSS